MFHQDAFGNEVDTGAFSSNSWSTARGRDYRITEHQTGKDQDPDTGLYYFHARWYDPEVRRFVGREPLLEDKFYVRNATLEPIRGNPYLFAGGNPARFYDADGRLFWVGCGLGAIGGAVAGLLNGMAACCGDESCISKRFIYGTIGGLAGGCLAGWLGGGTLFTDITLKSLIESILLGGATGGASGLLELVCEGCQD